jgi:hypothetical protein
VPRRLIPILVLLSLAWPLAALLAGANGSASGAAGPDSESNPCLGPKARHLRCPDLQMKRPYDMFAQRTPNGHVLLHATSAIKSRGRGPLEIHGKRIAKRKMRVTQRIYRIDGSHLDVRTKGRLYFFFIPGQGRYWKFTDAARFELWSLDRDGDRKRLVRTGPKVRYCLRDLVRTSPASHSPRWRLYPGCSQDPGKKWVTLGTSVGWSDVYPSTYYEQFIDVTGFSGCFAYVLVADPKDHIHESHEDNNDAQRIVRLPFGSRRKCP